MQDIVTALAGKTQRRGEDGASVGSLDGRKGAVKTVQTSVGESVCTGGIRSENGEGAGEIWEDGFRKGLVGASGELGGRLADRGGFGICEGLGDEWVGGEVLRCIRAFLCPQVRCSPTLTNNDVGFSPLVM